MRRWIIATIIIFISTRVVAWNIPDGFQELKWGMSFDQVVKLIPRKLTSINSKLPGVEEWTDFSPKSIGKVPLKLLFLYFMERKLVGVHVTFHAEYWPTLKEAMLIRFGQPSTSETSILQNRMGASFQQETLWWHSESVTIYARRFTFNLKSGSIKFFTPPIMEVIKQTSREELGETIRGF